MKKPEILSDEKIEEVIGKRTTERYLARHATDTEARAIAQKQLDDCYKEMLGQFIEWGNGLCAEHQGIVIDWTSRRHSCPRCWQALLSQLDE